MSTAADVVSQAKVVRDAIAKIVDLPEDKFLRPDLGKFSFHNIEHEIKTLLHILRELRDSNLEAVPMALLNQYQHDISTIDSYLRPLTTFDPLAGGANPKEQRDALSHRIAGRLSEHISRITALVSYLGRGSLQTLEAGTKERLEIAEKEANAAISRIESAKAAADRMLESLKETSGKASVSRHAGVFENQAKEHLEASNLWFWGFTLLTLGGLTLVWLFFIGPQKLIITKEMVVGEVIYNITSRLLFFSIISYAIYWAARNYLSHRHNYIVNKHRQNALETFETFANAPTDIQVRDAVLLQAAQTIFSAQSTGYMENEPIPRLVGGAEIIKTIIPKD